MAKSSGDRVEECAHGESHRKAVLSPLELSRRGYRSNSRARCAGCAKSEADRGGPPRAPPFAADVFRWRAVGGLKPSELDRAEWLDLILRTYPGYTLFSLLAEDAHEVMVMLDLLSDDCGKVSE